MNTRIPWKREGFHFLPFWEPSLSEKNGRKQRTALHAQAIYATHRKKIRFFRFVGNRESVVFLVNGKDFRKICREKQKTDAKNATQKHDPRRTPNVIKPLFLLCGMDIGRATKPLHRSEKFRKTWFVLKNAKTDNRKKHCFYCAESTRRGPRNLFIGF